jgi:hypothetical protein
MKRTLATLGRNIWGICEQAVTGARSFPEWEDFGGTALYRAWRREAHARIGARADGSLFLPTHDGLYELRARLVGGQGWGPALRTDFPYSPNKYAHFLSSRTPEAAKTHLLMGALLYRYEIERYGAASVDLSRYRPDRAWEEADTSGWPSFRTGSVIPVSTAAAKKAAPAEIGYIPPQKPEAKKKPARRKTAKEKLEKSGGNAEKVGRAPTPDEAGEWGDLRAVQRRAGSNDLPDPLTAGVLRAARRQN